MPAQFRNYATRFVIVFLAAACVADETSVPPAVTAPSDTDSIARLTPWAETYLAFQKVGNPVQTFEMLVFDRDLFERLHNAERTSFAFGVNENYEYLIRRESIFEFDGGWFLNGTILGHDDYSEARIVVHDDGSMGGSLFVQGLGTFIIQPTAEPPHHLVFLRTGSYPID